MVLQRLEHGDVTAEEPTSVSPRDGAKGTGHWAAPGGELWLTEYRGKCHQLSLACADGIMHGWADPRASKGTWGTTLSTCVNVCEGLCASQRRVHTCAPTAGERGALPVTDFPPGHHIIISANRLNIIGVAAICCSGSHTLADGSCRCSECTHQQ